jgi:hypothetical protein
MAKKAKTAGSDLNLLFIGNSFTARNNLPGMLERMAAERSHAVQHRLISAGGAPLKRHWNASTAAEAIATDKFTHVVLQEQSTLPIKSAPRMHESVRLFDQAIRAAGARTVLYLTWARRHTPETQQAISTAYLEIGRELEALVVPAGLAWERFLSQHDTPELHDKDNSHPTPAGTYLAACVFFATLFQESPVGLSGESGKLPAEQAATLQQAAWDTVREFVRSR